MAITVKQNKPGGIVVVRDTATGYISLNSASIGANSVNEEVQEMYITGIKWNVSGTNTWTIARGANTVAVLSGSGSHNYDDDQMRLELPLSSGGEATANVVYTKSGGTGTILIKLHKVSGE